MKWLVTVVPMSSQTRRRTGKSRTITFDTHGQDMTAVEVEAYIESSIVNVKVIDVRPTD